jgi:hypothetical protein
MNKQRKTSNILNVFQYDEITGAVTLPSTLVLTAPANSDDSTKVPTTSWTRNFVASLGYVTGNQSVTISGDATGSGTTSIELTLANTAVTPGIYGSSTLVPVVTVDSKGRITSVSTASISGALTFTGDVTGTGTTGTSTQLTLANSGVTAGTYTKVTVDSKGRVTVGANATTSDISEGTNLYYTDARVLAYLGANNYATQSYVGTQIANLIDSAPGTLDTLNELAAALGDDPNFATTVATSIGTKQAQLNGTGFVKVSGTTVSYDNSTYLTSFTETDPIYVASSWYSTTNNSSNWNTAFGWGNHASAGYLTTSSAASTYVSLTGSYANPSWITSLAYSKITGVPAFLTSYTETDTLASVTGRGASTSTAITISSSNDQPITLNATDSSWVYVGLSWNGTRRSYIGLNGSGQPVWGTDTGSTFIFEGSSSMTLGGNTVLHSGNYNSYSPSLTGSGASGSWSISITGNAATANTATFATNSSRLYSTDAAYSYTSANPYHGYLTYDGSRWLFQVSPASPASVRVAYSDLSGNSSALGGYGPNQSTGAYTIVQRDANGYIQNSYFYTSAGGAERNGSGLSYVAGFNSSDYYIRSYNSSAVASMLGLGSMAYASTGSYLSTGGGTVSGRTSFQVNQSGTGYNVMQIETYTSGTGVAGIGFHRGGYTAVALYHDGDGLKLDGNKLLTAGNYTSYSPSLTGGGASGTWAISITGSAATPSQTTTNYAGNVYNNPQVYFGNSVGLKVAMTGAWSVWSDTLWINGYAGGDVLQMCALHTLRNGQPRMAISVQASNSGSYGTFYEFITAYNIGSQSVSNADTVDGYHATNAASGLAYYASNGYLIPPSWVRVDTGIFSVTNNAHFRPNTGSYGSWEIIGSRNGWSGIWFSDSANTLMMNANESGHYNQSYGWQFRWNGGVLYCSKNSSGGGTEATVLDSVNSPYAWNMNQYVRTSDSPTFYDIYSNQWLRNNVSNTGLYNQSTTMHWSSNSNDFWNASSTSSTVGIRFYTGGHVSSLRGFIYADSSNNIGFLTNDGNWAARVDSSKNLTVIGDVTAFSDARVKTNVKTIENALTKTLALRGVSYTRTDSDDKKTKIGVIAQETMVLLPEVVNQDNDGMYNVSYGNMAGLFIEAIKEQQLQIEDLKNKLELLTQNK